MTSLTLTSQQRESLEQTGAIYIGDTDGFLTDAEWEELEELCFQSHLPYETVTVGDANEPNLVEVGRFMTDVEQPRKVNAEVTDRLLQIIAQPARMRMLGELLNCKEVYLRRAQVNHMHRGSFVGMHLDTDSNPDYQVSIVLQIGRAFSGGEFAISLPDGTETLIEPKFRSTIISRCDYPHEVRTVTQGTRTSIVYFVASHDGPNRRYLKAS